MHIKDREDFSCQMHGRHTNFTILCPQIKETYLNNADSRVRTPPICTTSMYLLECALKRRTRTSWDMSHSLNAAVMHLKQLGKITRAIAMGYRINKRPNMFNLAKLIWSKYSILTRFPSLVPSTLEPSFFCPRLFRISLHT